MRFVLTVICCLVIAGCSRGATGSLPGTLPASSVANLHDPLGPRTTSRNASSYKILYTFLNSPDAANPFAGLIDVKGELYGTTVGGGDGNGAVFKISTSGAESVVYAFTGSPDGSGPFASLTESRGVFYGTTYAGGTNSAGTVFEIAGGKEKVVHSFGASGDGNSPYGAILDDKGTLYGTTAIGGNSACYSLGCGIVFKITSAGTESVFHTFAGEPNDGSFPDAGLVEVKGAFYGTTRLGGTNKLGTVFKIEKSGKETVLHSFQGGSDGYYPEASLLNVGGTLYGTTVGGGTGNSGTVFSITTTGKENVVYSFHGGSDGINPEAPLIDVNGALYGTTYEGGAFGYGTVFSVTPSGKENVLYSFQGYPSDGDYPQSGLTYLNGALYGTTDYGSTGCVNRMGLSGCGIVFSIAP